MRIRDVGTYHIDYLSQTRETSIDTNYTIRATSDPDAPPEFKLPELGGTLMPHQLCNGTRLPQYLVDTLLPL